MRREKETEESTFRSDWSPLLVEVEPGPIAGLLADVESGSEEELLEAGHKRRVRTSGRWKVLRGVRMSI